MNYFTKKENYSELIQIIFHNIKMLYKYINIKWIIFWFKIFMISTSPL